MKILFLALCDKDYPQLLSKFDAQIRGLQRCNPDTQGYVIGDGNPREMLHYCFQYISIIEHKDKLAVCSNLIDSLNPDITYMRYTPADKTLFSFVERHQKIVFEHNSIEMKELSDAFQLREAEWGSKVLARACGLVCVTQEILRHEQERAGQSVPGLLLPNGVHMESTSPLTRLVSDRELHICMAARFDHWHGVERLFTGLRNYPGRANVRLHLAGSGPAIMFYKDLVKSYGLSGQVHFHGWLNSEQLKTLLATCHLAAGALAPSSNGLSEICSLKHRQYASLGIPFFFAGSDPDFPARLPFSLSLPDDGSPIDFVSLRNFADQCASTPDLAEQAHRYAKTHLSWEAKSERLSQFIKELVATPSPQREKAPLISIVVPCYNHARFLPDTIASLATQDFRDFEVVVVNDGSLDNTSEVTMSLATEYPELAIRLLEQENRGLSEARNSGIQAARGQWIQLLDSDDLLARGFLRAAADAIEKNIHISAIFGSKEEFGARNTPWHMTIYLPSQLKISNTLVGTSLFRRSLWECVGGYDSSHPWGIEDWHFWLKCQSHGWIPLCIPDHMLHYRIHETSSMYTTMMERWNEALAMHHTMLPQVYSLPVLFKAQYTLLSMSPETEERLRQKTERFPDLSLPWFWLGLAHDGRGERDEAMSCYLKAIHLGQPEEVWQAQYRLFCLYRAIGHLKGAAVMRKAFMNIKPELSPILDEQDACLNLARQHQAQPEKADKRVLLMGEFFWPSLGGIEVFLEELGRGLITQGYEVHVATKILPNRSSLEHEGIHIHQFPFYFDLSRGVPGGVDDLDFLIEQCGFTAVIMLAHPDPWSMYVCNLPQPRPRIIYMPIINNDNIQSFIRQGVLPSVFSLIEKADTFCRITENACDAQMLACAKIVSHFVPHMIPEIHSDYNFCKQHSIAPDTPLFAHVANFWPVKNHLELIKSMRKLHGDWRLVFIGSPHDESWFQQVEKAVKDDPRFILLGRQPREVAMALEREADLLLLPSLGEGCPMVILEAMSCGTPWLATPECGSVRDQAGGIVAPLSDFPLIIEQLMLVPQMRSVLGKLGREHWETCFSPEVVLPMFKSLIENDESSLPDLRMPPRLRVGNKMVRKDIFEALALRYGIFIKDPFQ